MVRPKKHLGQHFLRDENIAKKIVSLINTEIPALVEVGPGTGMLTKYLLELKGMECCFLEVDRESVQHLANTFPDLHDRLIEADFLKFDLKTLPLRSDRFTLIGNFPYNISSQILFRVLDFRSRIPEVIGMFQKEVAERIASPPGNKSYGILSVLLQAFYDIEYLFSVNESVFTPPPKVKSAVIRLRHNGVTRLSCDERIFRIVVRTAFNQRRKTLRNALKNLDTNQIRSIVGESGGILPTGTPSTSDLLDKRAEQLSACDFVRLATEIAKFAKI